MQVELGALGSSLANYHTDINISLNPCYDLGMDPRKKLLREIHTRAKRYAMAKAGYDSRGSIVDPEDFAQEVVLYVIENNREDPGPMLARYADYLRKQFGRVPRDETKPVTKAAKNRQAATLKVQDFYVKLNNSRCVVRQNEYVERRDIPDSGKQPNLIEILADNIYLDNFFRKVPRERRLVYILHHKYGYPLHEIGEMVGLTESRMSHFVTETQEQIDYNLRVLKIRNRGRPKKATETP